MEKSSESLFVELTLLPEQVGNDEAMVSRLQQQLGEDLPQPLYYRVLRKSLDARKKPIVFRLRVEVASKPFLSVPKPKAPKINDSEAAIVVGCGPAGLFAALELLRNGIKPIVLERGKPVRERRRDLVRIPRERFVDPESNYCFGEGGAGTFSDGKLYTRSKKRGDIHFVLNTLVEHGAREDILVEAHPHIGTNKLPEIVQSIREYIIHSGGEVHFEHRVEGLILDQQRIQGVHTNYGDFFAPHVILATGHSARDVFEFLNHQAIHIESKPFALGVRIEHQQNLIDRIQYRCADRGAFLPPASYSLVHQVNGRGVFSFCMCPGGIIAPAMTASDEVVVNGWSPSKRNGQFANSGFVVQVEPRDWKKFENDGALAAVRFQSEIEQTAFKAAGSDLSAPAQRASDLMKRRTSTSLPDCSYMAGVRSVDLREVLPPDFIDRIAGALHHFNKRMPGYGGHDALLVGVESRTSSPIRIPRDRETLEHPDISGFYPCGEGAGYAGGIMSAALDGIACANRVAISLGKLPSTLNQTEQR